MNNATPINTSGYSAIQFWIYGNGNTLNVHTQATDEGPESVQILFTPPAGQWTQMTVALSALGNPGVIKRINVQEFTGAPQATIYLDDIMLIR